MRFLIISLLIIVSFNVIGQNFPERPNKYSTDSLRIGEWITFYDSLGEEITRDALNISHYCLMKINNGKPFGQIECFYENGIRSWVGRMVTIDPEIKQGRALGYHKNGTLWSKAFYENDTIQGPYTSYHPNGILETEGEMIDGKKVGKWIYFYDNGNPIGTISHIDGKENGQITIYYSDGKINSKGEMIDDEKNGYWETYYESGTLANKGHYIKSKRVGEWIYYYESGALKDIGIYKEDKEVGNHKRYYENGKLESDGMFKDGYGNGYFEYFYENGQLSSKGLLGNGDYQGFWTFYYDNGVKKSEGNYIDDENDGLWKYYFDNGKDNREVSYKLGKENGHVIYYFENGMLNAQGEFNDGQKHGTWEYYFPNGVPQGIENYQYGVLEGYKEFRNEQGNLLNKGIYKNEKKHGLWEFYHENGSLSSVENYQDGISQGLSTAYFENGNKKNEGNYQNDVREGLWSYYYSNGELFTTGNYKEGNSRGIWKYYHDNGKLKKEGEELADAALGEWIFYDESGRISSRGSYTNNLLHGPHFFYDSLGNIESETLYFYGVGQTFNNLYDSVDNLSLNGKYSEAEQTLVEAEKAYFNEFDKNALKKADLYELLATVARRKGDYKKAIKFTKKSLNHALKFKADTSVWYTTTLDDLGDIYTLQTNHEKANQTYQEVIQLIDERPNGKLSDEYASSYRYYTVTLMNLDRQAEAIELLQKDLAFRESLPNQNINIAAIHYSIMDGLYPNLSPALDTAISNSFRFHEENNMQNHWVYASTHYYKALVFRDRKNLDSAYNHFKSFVQITASKRDTIDADYVNSLISLGNHHYNKLEYDLSRPYYRRAGILGENPKLKNSWIYIDVIKALSNQYWVDDDYPNTIKYSQLLADLAKDSSRIGQGLSGLGLVYDQMGDEYAKDAEVNHLKAIEVLSGFKNFNPHFINANLHYANHLNNQNREKEETIVLKKMKDYLLSFNEIDSFYLYRLYYDISSNFYEKYNYDSAIFYFEKIIQELEGNPGKSLKQYLESYRQLGSIFSEQNKDEKAGIYFFRSLNETEKFLGKKNEFYMYALRKVAQNFANQSNPTSAIEYYNKAIELAESIRGKGASISTRIELAEELIKIQKYDEALSELNYIQNTYIELNETHSYNYTWCLRIKSRVYERLDDQKNAEDQLLQGLAIVEKMYATDSRDYASYIRRVGEFYLRNNESELAYQYIAPAFEIIKNTFSDEVIIYAWYAETMSEILYDLDDYAQAVNLLEKAAEIYLQQLGEGQSYMDAQFSLGQILAQLGQYEKSIQALEKSRKAVLKEYGRYSFAYTTDTREIAKTYLLWKKGNEALKELKVVKNLYDSIGIHRSYYATLNNYTGWALLDLNQLQEGKRHYEIAIQIADSTWGKTSVSAMVYRSNLAFYHLKEREYEKAEKLWLDVEKKSYTSDLANVNWLDNMAMLYTAWDKLDIAESYWNPINELLLNKIKGDFPLLSESGKAAFWDAYKGDFEIFNTYAIKAHLKGNNKALGQMYDNQLQTKSLLLNSTTKERKRILNSGDKTLLAVYKRYVDLKERLAKYYGYSQSELAKESINLEQLEIEAERLEKALSISSADQETGKADRNLNWKTIQKNLLPTEAAIEIIRFRYFDNVKTDSVVYAALILTANTKDAPILEILPNGDFLEEKAIKAYRSSMKFKIEDKRSYDSFWVKIDQHLNGIQYVYLSSDGVYHQLNVSTLKDKEGRFINEKYDTRLVSSTRTIAEVKKRNRSNSSNTAYIFGNPKFDLSHTLIESDLKERGLTNTPSYTRATTLDDFSFSELPGTKIETETVNDVLAKNQWTTNLYLGEDALEEELKRVDNPSILHIATHGFFLDQPDENTSDIQLGVQAEASRKNPLLRSGLLMTGATQTAKGEQNSSIENGIFTAYEAMNLDLSSTELVILSACETGLGEIKNGEGVFGLQRAFQIAGAKSILMSLWKVDDDATQLLMTTFYKAWLSGATETDALHTAQETVRKQYPHPNYWGAFVLVGG
jgi:antitoxin component YwqK of YwqJK toxin-antitoxin module/CHAT domain-containing protein